MGTPVQRLSLLPLFPMHAIPRAGPSRVLFPLAAPHACRATALSLAPGALSCQAPRQQDDAGSSKFTDNEHWLRQLQKRNPGSGTFLSVLIVSSGQDLTVQAVGYKGFSKAREIGPSIILMRKRRQREVL